MAITTLDGVLAGMQYPQYFAKAVTGTMVAGRPWSLWGLAGNPGAGAYDNTTTGVSLTSPQAGQIPYTNPVSGNCYLARFQAGATISGTLLLCDRLWHNGGLNTATNATQNFASAAWPARDNNGSTNGEGVLLGLEISATCGAAAPTITVEYVNSTNTGGTRSAVNTFPTANSPAARSFFPIGLQSGDTGVRSVSSLTLSVSWVSGTMNLVAYRVLAALELTGAYVPNAIDAVTSGFPQMYNGTVPFFIFIPSTTTTSNISGQIIYTHG